jgi:nucleotide-binding universal stress UspA family protein
MSDKLPRVNKLLVATDLSDEGDRAIAVGRSWAERFGAQLVAAHVMPRVTRPEMLFPQTHAADVNAAFATGRAVTEQLQARVGPRDTVLLLDGSAGEALLGAAHNLYADMIVLGGREPSGKRVFGSVAEYILTHSRVPVLIARPQTHSGRIVAAIDANDDVGRTIDYAASFADPPLSAQVIVVYVPPSRDPIDAEAGLALKRVRRRLPDATEVRLEYGEPASAIVAVAERTQAELIIIGTHGRKGLSRLVIGSVASTVARRASCSVLVVPLQR